MFDDIGAKIKGLARGVCYVGIFASIIIGLICLLADIKDDGMGAFTIIGLAVMVLGSLLSWLSTFLLYGYGELIDKTCEIEKSTYEIKKSICDGEAKSTLNSQADEDRKKRIEKLHSEGLITEEEYRKVISK